MIEVKSKLYNIAGSIKNINISQWVLAMLDITPQAFWEKATSSTGKYHRADENQPGGQIIHTMRVCLVAEHLVRMDELTEIERDILLAAAILHDICKYGVDGKTEHTLSEHPQLVNKLRESNMLFLPPCEFDTQIINTIEQHSGRWTIAPFPTKTKLGRLLHIADFIASRYDIDVKLKEV